MLLLLPCAHSSGLIAPAASAICAVIFCEDAAVAKSAIDPVNCLLVLVLTAAVRCLVALVIGWLLLSVSVLPVAGLVMRSVLLIISPRTLMVFDCICRKADWMVSDESGVVVVVVVLADVVAAPATTLAAMAPLLVVVVVVDLILAGARPSTTPSATSAASTLSTVCMAWFFLGVFKMLEVWALVSALFRLTALRRIASARASLDLMMPPALLALIGVRMGSIAGSSPKL